MKQILLRFSVVIALFSTANAKDSVSTIDDSYIDFPHPDLSAFAMLGATPNTISRPGAVQELSTNILNVLSAGKSIMPGLAIEWAPYLTISKHSQQQIRKYQECFLRSAQITCGTMQDSLGSRVAYGLKWTYDEADPLMNTNLQNTIVSYLKRIHAMDPLNDSCRQLFQDTLNTFNLFVDSTFGINKGMTKSALRGNFPLDDSTPTPVYIVLLSRVIATLDSLSENHASDRPDLIKRVDSIVRAYLILFAGRDTYAFKTRGEFQDSLATILTNYKKKNWNKQALQIAIGQVLGSADYTWQGLGNEKVAFILSYRHPLSFCSFDNFGMQSLYQVNYSLNAATDSGLNKNCISGGWRLITGNSDKRVSLEGLYSAIERNKTGKEERVRLTGGFEFQLIDGTWLDIAIGTDSKTSEFKKHKANFLSLFNLKYALTPHRRFDMGN